MHARLVLPVGMAFAAMFGAGFADLVPTSMAINEVRPASRVLDQHQSYPSDMMFVESPAIDLSPRVAIGPDYYGSDDEREYLIPVVDIGQRGAISISEVEPRENDIEPGLHTIDRETELAEPSRIKDDPYSWSDAPVDTKAPMS